jgi:hypothetical protein
LRNKTVDVSFFVGLKFVKKNTKMYKAGREREQVMAVILSGGELMRVGRPELGRMWAN